MSIRRKLGLTLGFVATGAVAGAAIALLSLAPIWLGWTSLPRDFLDSWALRLFAVVGAGFGVVLMPIFGWLVIGRVSFWPAVLLPSVGAVLGENIAAWALWSLQMDVQIIGAFLVALVTVLVIRLTSPIRRLSPPLTPERS